MNIDNENLYQLSNSSFILNDNDYHRQLTLVLYLPFFIDLMVDLMKQENIFFDQILANYFPAGRWNIREGQSGAMGYGSVMKLSENEVNALPIHINLRGLDVFIHFLGRYLDRIDSIDTVKQSIQNAALRGSWVQSNKEKLKLTCNQT